MSLPALGHIWDSFGAAGAVFGGSWRCFWPCWATCGNPLGHLRLHREALGDALGPLLAEMAIWVSAEDLIASQWLSSTMPVRKN